MTFPFDDDFQLCSLYLDFSHVIIIRIDADETVTFINRGASTILGYTRDELTGKNWFDTIIPGGSRETFRSMFHSLVKKEISTLEPGEETVFTKTGEERIINWDYSILRDDNGAVTGILISGTDITLLKKAKKDLLHTNANLQAMIDNTDDFIMIADRNGFPMMYNDNYRLIFKQVLGVELKPGVKPHSLLGNPEMNAYWDSLHKRVLNGEKFSIEFKWPINGSERQFEFTFYPIYQDNVVVGFSEHSRDITERIKQEEEQRQSEKMRAIGQLAGGIAHDFNNHMTGILGCADLLRLHLKDDEHLTGLVNLIISSAQQTSKLTNQLLAFSKKRQNRTDKINIVAMLHELVSLLQLNRNKNIQINISYKDRSPVIKADSSQLQNVFFNMLVNGCEAMPDGGSLDVAVSISNSKTKLKKMNLPLDAEICRLTISDTGTGMDKETLGRIFEPFFTTKSEGTGMGLATAYGTINSYGGLFEVKSEPGRGTTFSIYLPLSGDDVDRQEPDKKKSIDVHSKGASILVVDDEAYILKTTTSILKHHGFRVASFTRGSDAIEHYKKNSNSIDLVITDVIMPDLDGYGVYRHIVSLNSDARFLIMSGYNPDRKIEELLNMKQIEFMSKPFLIDTLLEKINILLNNGI
jgi:two-component system cell cycle sensor histidine kinase/response regulator CckA